jgi:hypothetical protein
LNKTTAIAVLGAMTSALLWLAFQPVSHGSVSSATRSVALPYSAMVKGTVRALPCCNVAAAFLFVAATTAEQVQMLHNGYAAATPMLEEGTVVSVTAIYRRDPDGVPRQSDAIGSPYGALAFVTTPEGAVGYVPAAYVFPP